jgi:hypothetical protein
VSIRLQQDSPLPPPKKLNTTIHGAITCIFNLCDKLGCSQWQKIGESTTISSIVGVVSLPFSSVLGFMFIYKGRLVVCLLDPAPTGTGPIALDPTFESFTLLEPVSLMKVFRLFRLERIFLVFRVWTQ